MKVGLIGYGVVGKAAENTFQKEYDIVKYDKYQDLDDFKSLLYCDFVICSMGKLVTNLNSLKH